MNKDNEQLWESYVSEKKHDEEKTVSSKADLNKDGKLSGYEKKRADAIAGNDDDPKTHKNKSYLKRSISKFERETGLKWPFK